MHIENLVEGLNFQNDLFEIKQERPLQNMTFVLFGATGDLARRKLFPALYNLYLDGKLPETISIVGLGRDYCPDEIFQSKVKKAIYAYSRRSIHASSLPAFLEKFRYCSFDATEKESYYQLRELIEHWENELGIPQNRLFYLSVAPGLIDIITSNLSKSGISQNNGWRRFIVEKPFGNSLKTARKLNENLSNVFREEEIYRIDHYLGKPMVQNLRTLILANPILESLLNHNQISNVQITASETVGVENRADYYDKAGAIRDMVQNHLLQLVTMTAVYLSDTFMKDKGRVKKTDIIASLEPIQKEKAYQSVVRGQYGPGEVQGNPVIGYKEEPGVNDSSTNDTFFAARLSIEHPSWNGIPFYIRTGKRMNQKSTRIVIEFENKVMDLNTQLGSSPNLMILEISPNESISLRINLKDPSSTRYKPVWIDFSTTSENQPEAYELLLYDALRGDSTFFADWREVELSWKWIQPLLEAYQEELLPLYSYPAGSTGPEMANELLLTDQSKWW